MSRKKSPSPIETSHPGSDRAFGWLIKPIAKLQKTPFETMVRAPASLMTTLKESLERAFNERLAAVGQNGVLLELIPAIPEAEVPAAMARAGERITELRQQITGDDIGRALLAAYEEAHAAVPWSPIAVLVRDVDFALQFEKHMESTSGVFYAQMTRGEESARLALEGVGAMSERLYQPYLEKLWRLARYRLGRAPSDNVPAYGGLPSQLPDKWRDELIEPLAVKVRNAVGHGKYRYDTASRSMEFWDKDGSRSHATRRELLALAGRMHHASAVLMQKVTSFYIHRLYLESGVLEASASFGTLLRKNAAAELQLVTEDIERRLGDAFAQLAACHAGSLSPS